MPELKNQRDALLQAMYQGVLTVKAGDKSVMYKSNKKMLVAMILLYEQLALREGKSNITRIMDDYG